MAARPRPRPSLSRRVVVPALICLGLTASTFAADNPLLVAPTDPLTAAEQQQKFHLPPGFVIELVASEPEIRKPINLNFDARGRLYATQSVEYPFPPAPDQTPRDEIRVFTDTDADGTYDRAESFAEGLTIPIGVVPLPDSVLGYSIPQIFRFVDEDGDGRADRREPVYGNYGFHDTHGMASSFNHWIDGWIYACHGFSNTSTVKGADGKEITMHSGNTYRLRGDGSHIEYFTHGQVNPFGLTIDPLGNVYSSDCHSKPIYMLLRGAWYPSFGKPHDGLGYGPEMIEHSHGSTGIAGIAYYAADQYPPEYRDTVFIGNPVTGRVNRDVLEPHGATYRAVEQPDFLTCDDPWFRPVDVRLGPDGALYIADFYNRIIGHYEVPLTHPRRDRERGRIWRVVYRGQESEPRSNLKPVVDLTRAGEEQLLAALGDPNLVVRTHATHQLVHRHSQKAVSRDLLQRLAKLVIEDQTPPVQRVHALWVLERTEGLAAGQLISLSRATDRQVRVHLMKALAERGTSNDSIRTLIAQRLEDTDPFVRRAAAEALGRLGATESVAALLKLWKETPADDTHLIHVVRIALRDILQQSGDPTAIAKAIKADDDSRQRIAELCLGIPQPAAADFLLTQLTDGRDRKQIVERVYHVARHAAPERTAAVTEFALALSVEKDDRLSLQVIRAINRGVQERGQPLDDALRFIATEAARRQMQSAETGVVREGADFARELRLQPLVADLEQLVAKANLSADLRIPLLEALLALDGLRAVPVLAQVSLAEQVPLDQRQKAAELLGNLNLPAARTAALVQLKLLPNQVALSLARGMAGNAEGAAALLQAVTEGKAAPRLLQDTVVDGRLKTTNPPKLKERLELLLKDLPPEDERLAQIIAARRTGFRAAQPDAALGGMIFAKNCAACHKLASQGNKIGPELDGIGLRGVDRLIEDTLSPNLAVDQAFRATIIALKDGKVVNGLLLRQEGAVLIVADDQGREIRVAEGDIEERTQSPLSPMPANVAEKLPEQDLYHLLAFLLNQRQAPPADAKP